MDRNLLSDTERQFLIRGLMGLHHAMQGEEFAERHRDHLAFLELAARVLRADTLDPGPASELADALQTELSWRPDDRRLRMAFEAWRAAIPEAEAKRRERAAEVLKSTLASGAGQPRREITDLLPQ